VNNENYLFSKDHLWVRPQGVSANIGITNRFMENLDDLAFIELPEVGATLEAGDVFAVLDTLKCTHELFSPVSGEVLKVNEEIRDNIYLLAESPQHEGWLVVLGLHDPAEIMRLMTWDKYRNYCAGETE
jgi:glycine cleavage system H protein